MELTESRYRTKYRYFTNKLEIEVLFSTLAIANFIEVTPDGVYVNGARYVSLFDAFSGILAMFMQQIRLLYMYRCELNYYIGIHVCNTRMGLLVI